MAGGLVGLAGSRNGLGDVVAEQSGHDGHELDLREPLAGAVLCPFGPGEVGAARWEDERLGLEVSAGRPGRDPALWTPGERVGTPVSRVGMHRLQVRLHQRIGRNHVGATVDVERRRMLAGVFRNSRERVVQSKRLNLAVEVG